MADVLMIAGKPETIFKARDFEYLVEKHMGYEAAKYFREYAEKADEADLESNRRAFQDIQDELICISNILRWKRMNRELLSDHVKRIKTIISNQL